MFDIGFWELSVIAIVALVVIGPERLPGVARQAGLWFGRLRGFVLTVKSDIDRELHLEEVRRLADKAQSSQLHDIIEETESAVGDLRDAVDRLPDHVTAPAPDPLLDQVPGQRPVEIIDDTGGAAVEPGPESGQHGKSSAGKQANES